MPLVFDQTIDDFMSISLPIGSNNSSSLLSFNHEPSTNLLFFESVSKLILSSQKTEHHIGDPFKNSEQP
jgi:hypothetical protein